MAEDSRRYAGIAWTAAGFEVAVLDAAGRPVRALARFGPGQAAGLTQYLSGLAPGPGQPVMAVLDSTNGMLDGALVAAGLPVYRADPWQLPGRPLLGSVPARVLAEAGRQDPAALRRLTARGGILAGRGAEQRAGLVRSQAQATALAGAGRLARHGCREVAEVALTFDDGPNPPYTGQILAILDRYQVPATFFCVGLPASAHAADVARMAADGHGLGTHTWSHPFLPDLSETQLAEQLDRTDEVIARAAGQRPALFRPPYGSRSPDVLRWLGGRPAPVVLWDVDPSDWARPGAAVIAGRVLLRARPGTIILMHDGGGDRSQTVAALPLVIEGLLDRGFRFTRAADLLAAAAPPARLPAAPLPSWVCPGK
ncbi:MAG TPA: polysaccharide deacetylase family protein [Streptosporangiaceae bacterium]|nr:polysaccharide deacetylase family protein [Streptosporangiaceae bacterium]